MKLENYTTEDLSIIKKEIENKIKKLEGDIIKYHSAMFVWYCLSQIKILNKKMDLISQEMSNRRMM